MADIQDRKNVLIRELERSRSQLQVHSHALRTHANPVNRVRASFGKHRLAWFGGATLAGVILSRLRPKRVIVRRTSEKQTANVRNAGIALGVFKMLFDVVRPALTGWALKRVSQMGNVTQRSHSYRS